MGQRIVNFYLRILLSFVNGNDSSYKAFSRRFISVIPSPTQESVLAQVNKNEQGKIENES